MSTDSTRNCVALVLAMLCGLPLNQSARAAVLTNGSVEPKNGDLFTRFQFRVTYVNPGSSSLPQAMQLILDETVTNLMSADDPTDLDPQDGKVYVWSGTLAKARHRFRFATLPVSAGDVTRHWGPDVSAAALDVRQFYFFLDCPADYLADDFGVDAESRFISGGDLNADGYADLVHAWHSAGIRGHTNEGAVMVYYGPDFVQHDCLLHPRYPARERFGSSVAAGGDLDGDGCGDLVISSASPSGTRFFVYHGSRTGPPVLATEIQSSGAEDAAALVDVNQDGYADLVSLGGVVTVSPPDYWTTRLSVRRGPGLNAVFDSTFGISGKQTFNSSVPGLSITDRNGDGFPDLVLHGNQRAYSLNVTNLTWYASSGSKQIRAADGPNLSASVLQTHDYPWILQGIGDVDGDRRGDFVSGDADRTSLTWYGGPNLDSRGSITLPDPANTTWLGYFGAGNGAGSGRGSLVVIQQGSGAQQLDGLQYYWGPAATPFSSRRFLRVPLVRDLVAGRPSWGLAHDADGNGLDDFFVAAVGSPEAPMDELAGMTLGSVMVGSPCYPYPLSESDLPARLRTRLAGCTLNLGPLGTFPLSPNGSLEFIAGTADSNHLAPLIILAGSLQIPDKPIGENNGEAILLRVRTAGEDGSGYIFVDGPKKGQGQLSLWLSVQFIQPGTVETVLASDRTLAKVDLDPPLDLATGYGGLVCRGQMQQLLDGLSIAAEGASLRLAGYVDYVRPAESNLLARVPARVDFGGVCVGSNAPARRITLCNLGERPLRITGLSLPGLPFRISGTPTLPAIVTPTSALVLTAEYLPSAPGHHEATLNVASDDPLHPTLFVSLCGTTLPAGQQDTDGDGMPDSFEARYVTPTTSAVSGLSTNLLDGHLDNDNDGVSNLDEYFAGSDPTDPKSTRSFRLLNPRFTAGVGVQFGWLSTTGKTYTVFRSANANSGYEPLQTGIPGDGSTYTFTDPGPTNRPQSLFYRVGID